MEISQNLFLERATELGITLVPKPVDRVVVTGFAQLTALGDTEETWEGMQQGKCGIISYDANNWRTNIGAPIENFDPRGELDPKFLKEISRVSSMAAVLTLRAQRMAGMVDENGKLSDNIDKNRFGSWISTGYGFNQGIIGINETINHRIDKATGQVNPVLNSSRINPRLAIQVMPEQVNGSASIQAGARGWGGNTVEACATGLANPNEAIDKIRSGWLDIAVAGGLDDLLGEFKDSIHAIFSAVRATSARNNDPKKASRPFDRDRDGFVAASGGGVLVFESLEHAQARGAQIFAEVLGYLNSMDAKNPTEMDPDRVASTVMSARFNRKLGIPYPVSAIFAHATSTPLGDRLEARALRRAFPDGLSGIPITAIKSYLGHLLGGAGAVNAIAAIQALRDGKIPPILNLENPMLDPNDPSEDISDLNFVRGKVLERKLSTALVVAYGFGGYNSATLFGQYIP